MPAEYVLWHLDPRSRRSRRYRGAILVPRP